MKSKSNIFIQIIVYKVKEKPIYYLIEHQSTIDYNMAYRILNYCIDIMQEWIKGKKTGKETQYPIVIPIVLYTGRKKWTVATDFADTQIKETTKHKREPVHADGLPFVPLYRSG